MPRLHVDVKKHCESFDPLLALPAEGLPCRPTELLHNAKKQTYKLPASHREAPRLERDLRASEVSHY